MIRVTGVGLPPDNISNPSHKLYAIKRAAQVDAMRKLTESIRGVIIKGKTNITNGNLNKDEIEIRVDAILKSARTISGKELADGSYEIIMEAPINQ